MEASGSRAVCKPHFLVLMCRQKDLLVLALFLTCLPAAEGFRLVVGYCASHNAGCTNIVFLLIGHLICFALQARLHTL